MTNSSPTPKVSKSRTSGVVISDDRYRSYEVTVDGTLAGYVQAHGAYGWKVVGPDARNFVSDRGERVTLYLHTRQLAAQFVADRFAVAARKTEDAR